MKLGTSDKIFMWSMIIFGIWIFGCTYLIAFQKADLIGVIGLIVGFMGSYSGFMVNKTKNENLVKISQSSPTITTPPITTIVNNKNNIV